MLKSSSRQSIASIPSSESILLGLIAVMVVQTFRAGFQPSYWFLVIETCIYLAVPVIIFAMQKVGQSADATPSTLNRYKIQIAAIIFALIPILSQVCFRPLGLGDANEIVALLVLQNAAWFLIVFGGCWNFSRAGFMLAGALVLFVCFTTQRWQIHAFALAFSLIAMWWLMGNYWSRIETKLIDGQTKSLPIRWSFLVVSAAIVGVVGLIAIANEPIMNSISSAGFMPTSGGQQWTNDYANSGLGDGDMLSAGEDADTTGAVESDQFIEDNRPSIYDAINDVFDEPVIKIRKNKNKAQLLDEKAKHLHNVKQSEQSGKSFRTVRRKGRERKKRRYEDVISDAEFFVEGSVPVRFKVNTFNHFDGWDWSNRELSWEERTSEGIQIQRKNSEPWYVIQNQDRRFLPSSRQHRVKILRYKNSSLPSVPFLKRWHIYKVEGRTFFKWSTEGVVEFQGNIPPQTVVDIVGKVPNYHILRSSNNFTDTSDSTSLLDWFDEKFGVVHQMHMSQGREFKLETNSDSQFVQVADDATQQRIKDLAAEWTEGIKPGWNQIEAIVQRLRDDFELDPETVADPECENAIGDFLDNKAGPRYMFATAATQMLRAAGYKARLTTGYLVQREDYVRKAGQSIVTNENVHFWPEVNIDACHWIPLEPTPGYPVPFSTQTLYQFVSSKIAAAFTWMWRNPITTIFWFLVFGLAYRNRGKIIASVWWWIWYMTFHLSAGRRLKITRQLIDARFRAAGIGRPDSASVIDWFQQVDGSAGKSFYPYWLAANFSSNPPDVNSQSVTQACKQLVSDLPFFKIAKFAREQKKLSHSHA